MPASTANKARLRTQLETVVPNGGTDHLLAFRAGLKLKSEVIFFLTDADLMTDRDVSEVLTGVGSTQINAIEFGRGTQLRPHTPLGRLATSTGGSYLYIDVSAFPQSGAAYR
jgi:hypothetical protein